MFQQKNQNKIFVIGFILILVIITWSLARPFILRNSQQEKNEDKNINEEILKAPTITLKEFSVKMRDKENLFLVDLRNTDEFSKGHLAGATNFPAGANLGEQLKASGVEKTASIVVVNEGDNVFETAKATNELVSAGFVNAKYLRGGITDWRDEGYTLISEGKSPIDQNKIKKISIEKIASDLSGGDELIQFIDVRDEGKFRAGHIPRAVSLPLSSLEKDQSAVSPVKKVIIYGEGNEEANQAAVILFDLNFFNVYVLDGGLTVWENADGKIETSAN